MGNKYEEAALVFKALSDPNRLAIIDIIKFEERCACEILEELNITQPTLSHHMKILCDAGLVNAKRVGKWMHYSFNDVFLEQAQSFLNEFSMIK